MEMISPKMMFLLRNMGKFIKKYHEDNRNEEELKKLGLKIIKKLDKYVDIDDDQTQELFSHKNLADKDLDTIKDIIQQSLEALKEGGDHE